MAEWFGVMDFKSVAPGSNPALITSWSCCFSVVPSSTPRPCLCIANWSASGQLGFLLVIFSLIFLSRYLFRIFVKRRY